MSLTNYRSFATFCLLSILSFSAYAQPQVIDQVVAVVGTKIIMKSDVENQYTQYLASGNYQNDEIKCKLIDQMMVSKLLVNQAILDSVEVSEEQIEGELDRRIKHFISMIGSQEKLEEHFKKSVIEIKDEFRDLIREQMLTQNIQAKISKDVTITPSEVKSYYERIPADSLPYINAEYEVAQIVRKAPINREQIKAVKERLEQFKTRVAKGEDFSTLAVLYSEDPGSAKKGGELGFMGRGGLVAEFEAVAFSLKPNEISTVVETEFGYHIIQMIERRGNEVNVKHILLRPKVQEEDLAKAKLVIDSAAKDLAANKPFADVALKYSDDDDSRKNGGLMVNPQSGTSKFEADQMEPGLFFKIDKMKVGEISQVISYQTQDGGRQGYRIVLLKSKTEAHKANLQVDYQKIQNAALSEKQNNALRDWVKKKRGITFIQLSQDFKGCKDLKDWYPKEN